MKPSLTSIQTLRMFNMLFSDPTMKPRAIAMGMMQEGVKISNNHISRKLQLTPFTNFKLFQNREYEAHKRIVDRYYSLAILTQCPIEHKSYLRTVLQECGNVRNLHKWLSKPAPARELISQRMQTAGKIVSIVGEVTTPLEYFKASQALADDLGTNPPERIRNAVQDRLKDRMEIADTLWECYLASQISGLKSADLMATGGGSFSGKDMNQHQYDASRKLKSLIGNIPIGAKQILESCLFEMEILWDEGDLQSLSVIKFCLDVALMNDRIISVYDLMRRWPCVMNKQGDLAVVNQIIYARILPRKPLDHVSSLEAYAV